MKIITIKSHKKRDVVDITSDVNATLKNAGRETGICHLFVRHTTAALTTVCLDPETELELMGKIDAVVTHPARAGESEKAHTHHIGYLPPCVLASFVGSTLAIPISDGKLFLGKFQRVVLIDFEGPSEREVVVA
ncbi:hypothetical protein A3H16_03795 [Candidatus Kaiserbacteria bacterium RIFCSPLOWO2_12_FULL_53_8]|uniref:Secondary thiamine-phosphate synthase enzyme n=2 Tax=Candidatus Kaiseribacteriota TaxID=1752734 RepID=A0A1F6CXQ6_9BACT|nr:MAG: hypothetical protein A2851_01455 [Candidatus Kaiserbacteria bacterium RIFCSPHIGHO2_01_FULL_53_29]OGG91028.1 MAG: hypothetical protein A3H16_03795 [Candidatus Kaiserbacteria bacterium RIFCSPLOWO2_12_FULL_53_8]